MRRRFALAAAALATAGLVAIAAAPILAQSTGTRDYGGPLSIGPNFNQGGQHSTTDYGAKTPQKPKKKTAAKPSSPEKTPAKVAKPDKPRIKKETVAKGQPDSKAPPGTKSPPETGTPPETNAAETNAAETSVPAEAPAASETPAAGTAATDPPGTCRKFDATTGTTLTVACE